jgi:hypothetical protein
MSLDGLLHSNLRDTLIADVAAAFDFRMPCKDSSAERESRLAVVFIPPTSLIEPQNELVSDVLIGDALRVLWGTTSIVSHSTSLH